MPDLSAGAEIAGYQIEATVGRGGMGVVYRAWDPAVDRRVAIKPISAEHTQEPGFRERFKGESRLAASIRHPNVITVFRAGEDDGHLFIAMDYVEGTDLEALIRSRAGSTPSWPRRSSPRSPTRWTPHMRRGWCTAMSSPPTS
jgi:serine/threonine-protein kinase